MRARYVCVSRVYAAAIAGIVAVSSANAQPARASAAAAAIGTYASGTTRLPRSGGDGCWLEVAPTARDSLRVQVLCRYPPPGHHLGVLDARLIVRGDSVVYEARASNELCRIRVRFRGARALVEQQGSDLACGFGAAVNVGGTYDRLSARRPPFDLVPVERGGR